MAQAMSSRLQDWSHTNYARSLLTRLKSPSGAVNEEAEGVDIEKLGDGRYRISVLTVSHRMGGRSKCRKILTAIDFALLRSRRSEGILLKVFKPKLDLETGGIIAGESFDIPEGRWIDVRLQMPASSAYNVVQGKIAGQLESQQMAG
jgi:hypothetical protein